MNEILLSSLFIIGFLGLFIYFLLIIKPQTK